MFDETYMHNAENNSNENTIILFLDIERPVTFVVIKWINKLFPTFVLSSASTKNTKGDKVCLLNKAFFYIYQLRVITSKLKVVNKPLYYLVQYSFYLLLIYLFFL